MAVGIYFGLGKYVGQEMTGWLCILGAAPFAACGFFQYHCMNAEQFAWDETSKLYLKYHFAICERNDLLGCQSRTYSPVSSGSSGGGHSGGGGGGGAGGKPAV